jgi:hypothetical protein
VIELVARYILPAAYAVLPPKMNSPEASALILAIGLQESKFLHRRQIRGPARGFLQFEKGTQISRGGVTGLVMHAKTKGPLATALTELRYATAIGDPVALYTIIEHNDVVACVCARLLLWTLPVRLPGRDEADNAYGQYLASWRPGKPHPESWGSNFIEAWHHVDQL